MPARFPAATEACLKETMLARCAEDKTFDRCYFTAEDVGKIMECTGLSEEQINKWGAHFRERTPIDERDVMLQLTELQDEDVSTLVRRCMITLYNVSPALLKNKPVIVKTKTGGEYCVRGWVAVANEGTTEARIYAEFDDQIRVQTLRNFLTGTGAGSVLVHAMGQSNTGAESAITHVYATAQKHGWKLYVNGETRAKPSIAAPARVEDEFDAKTRVAMSASLASMEAQISQHLAPALSASANAIEVVKTAEDNHRMTAQQLQTLIKENERLMHMTFELRGQLGAQGAALAMPVHRENKRLCVDLENSNARVVRLEGQVEMLQCKDLDMHRANMLVLANLEDAKARIARLERQNDKLMDKVLRD